MKGKAMKVGSGSFSTPVDTSNPFDAGDIENGSDGGADDLPF
ncbi:MAG: hypothetical protein R2744_06150 [Bacteroidales bacterium]